MALGVDVLGDGGGGGDVAGSTGLRLSLLPPRRPRQMYVRTLFENMRYRAARHPILCAEAVHD